VNKLEKYLKHRCISQRSFAKKIGTTANNLNLLIRGKSFPGLRIAWEIEKHTGGLVTLYDWLPIEAEVIEKNISDSEKES